MFGLAYDPRAGMTLVGGSDEMRYPDFNHG
jgi:hypothetical protein